MLVNRQSLRVAPNDPQFAAQDRHPPLHGRTEGSIPIRKRIGVFTRVWVSSVNALAAAGVSLLFAVLIALLTHFAHRWGGILVCVPLGLTFTCIGIVELYRACRQTVMRSPASPIAVVAGAFTATLILLLSVFPISATFGARSNLALGTLAAALIAACLGAAAYRGTVAGLFHRYGSPKKGIGATCSRCLYDLRGIEFHTPCPECGGVYRFEWASEPRSDRDSRT
jgi:hypothetical protein